MGATGAQGSGLVRAIVSDKRGGFAARALTRNVNSEKVKELAKLGAEVVTADVDDVESLRKASPKTRAAYRSSSTRPAPTLGHMEEEVAMNLPRGLTRWMIASLGLFALLPLLLPLPSFAGPPKAKEVRVDTGSKQGQFRFFPSRLQFERGKYYKLLIHNPSPDAHYFASEGFATRIFTRKVEVIDSGGKTLVEIHGDIQEVELLPGQTVAWYFYPMTNGKNLKLYCHKEGHEEGGMVGQIEISGPPPFTGQ